MTAIAERVSSSSLARFRSTWPALLLLVLAALCPCCFGQLPTDLSLPSETINSGSLVFQASDSITNSGSNFIVQDPASVTLTAGSYIHLEPGFDAVATNGTATFQAVINPNVVNWQPIPVPAPPTPCTDCGENYIDGSSGTNPQFIFAPNTGNNTEYVGCNNTYPPYQLIPCNVSLSITAYANTNGHFHSVPPPPSSTISPTFGNTGNYTGLQMPVTTTTTQVGQIERLEVVDNDDGDVEYVDYAVGYDSLVYLGNSNIFAQTGGNSATSLHGDNTWNHWMTLNAATELQNAATDYINRYNTGEKICINDMALPIGGKFDLKNNWQSPHAAHDQGTAVDVAVISGQCSAISRNYLVNSDGFKSECTTYGATTAIVECGNTIVAECPPGCSSCHVHCQWPY
jgi:hypothetical protein